MASHQNGERSVDARKDEENPGSPTSSRPKIEANLTANLPREPAANLPRTCGALGREKSLQPTRSWQVAFARRTTLNSWPLAQLPDPVSTHSKLLHVNNILLFGWNILAAPLPPFIEYPIGFGFRHRLRRRQRIVVERLLA